MIDDGRTGLPLVAMHLAAVGGAVALLLIWVALGATARRLAGGGWRPAPSVRWPVDAALGLGVVGTAFLGLGALGLLVAPVVLGVMLAAALAGRHELASAAAEIAGAARSVGMSGWPERAAGLVALLFLLLLLAGAVAPPTEWDSLMYHLRIPLGFLEAGRIAVPRDSFHVALVGIAHLAMLPLLAAGLPTGPAVVQTLLLALTVIGTASLAGMLTQSRAASRMAALILLTSPAMVLVAITARVDVALVLVLVATQLALIEAANRKMPRVTMVAAALVGIGLAIRPQAGAFALVLVPLGLKAAGSWRTAVAAASCAVLIAAPWYVKNLLLVGAPLYPLGKPGWFEPWLAELFGGRVRPPDVDASILRALPESRERFDLWSAFTAPERLTIETEGRHYALSPAFLLVPLAWFPPNTRRAVGGLAAAAVAYCAIVIVPFGEINMRYLMPAFPALAVAAAAVLRQLLPRRSGAARTAAVVLVGLIVCWPLGRALWSRFGGEATLLRHAAGLISADQVRRQHPDRTVQLFAPVIEGVQRLVPADGRILLLWEARAMPLQREAIADVMLSNWSYLAQSPAYHDCLATSGITHVLVNSGALEYYLRRGADRQAFQLERFQKFRIRCLGTPVRLGTGFELFPVRAHDAVTSPTGRRVSPPRPPFARTDTGRA